MAVMAKAAHWGGRGIEKKEFVKLNLVFSYLY